MHTLAAHAAHHPAQRPAATMPPRAAAGRRPARGQRGVSLIEVLVAAVVLAIGLLGLAGLQLRGMQVNQGSAMRAQAGILAEDLADRMRSDYAATQSGSFIGAYSAANIAAAPVPSLVDWLNGLGALPAGTDPGSPCTGNVLPCVQIQNLAGATAPIPVRIDVYWYDNRASAAANPLAANPGFTTSGTTPATTPMARYTTIADL